MANDREIYCEILEKYLDAPVSPAVRGGTSIEKQKKGMERKSHYGDMS